MRIGNEPPNWHGPGPNERHQGSVVLRREAARGATADQGLLDSRMRSEWKTKDAWRALRILSEFVEGFDTLADLPPAVSVFGSARAKPDSPECELAERLGAMLAQAGYAVITGGGPGVMEAANKGAAEAGGLSIGLPGGFGTMDELFEALTLVQTKKVTRFPVVLMGTWYWKGLLAWMRDTMAAEGKIGPEDLDLLLATDSVEEAVAYIMASDAALNAASNKHDAEPAD